MTSKWDYLLESDVKLRELAKVYHANPRDWPSVMKYFRTYVREKREIDVSELPKYRLSQSQLSDINRLLAPLNERQIRNGEHSLLVVQRALDNSIAHNPPGDINYLEIPEGWSLESTHYQPGSDNLFCIYNAGDVGYYYHVMVVKTQFAGNNKNAVRRVISFEMLATSQLLGPTDAMAFVTYTDERSPEHPGIDRIRRRIITLL